MNDLITVEIIKTNVRTTVKRFDLTVGNDAGADALRRYVKRIAKEGYKVSTVQVVVKHFLGACFRYVDGERVNTIEDYYDYRYIVALNRDGNYREITPGFQSISTAWNIFEGRDEITLFRQVGLGWTEKAGCIPYE